MIRVMRELLYFALEIKAAKYLMVQVHRTKVGIEQATL
jgi:hypothetical protein